MGGGRLYGYPGFPSQTEKGIRNISQTILIFLIIQVLAVALLAALFPVFLAAAANPSSPDTFGAIVTAVAVVCTLFIVYLVALILGLIGVSALHNGRDEFGPAHAEKIDHGIIVLILGIIIPGIVGGIGGASSVAGAGTVGLSPRFDAITAATSLASGVLGAVLVGLFLLWTIETLATPDIRQRAILALVIGIAGGASKGAASLVVLAFVPPPSTFTDFSQLVPYLLPSVLSAGLGFVSLVLWYLAYRAVHDRFTRGELRAATPVMYPPPYVPPYYPYGQPYVPQAPPPPPQQPPPESPPPTNP